MASTSTDKKYPIVIGSSNLSSINLDKHPKVEVECYPDANFNHVRNMVTNYKGKSQPENIVLNIGINSKYQNGTSTVSQLRNMISSIRKRCPITNVYLIDLAAKSLRDIKIIPALPAGDFQVGQDQIHWTEATANKLYHILMIYLNLN